MGATIIATPDKRIQGMGALQSEGKKYQSGDFFATNLAEAGSFLTIVAQLLLELRKKISEFHSALRMKLHNDLTTPINSKLRLAMAFFLNMGHHQPLLLIYSSQWFLHQ